MTFFGCQIAGLYVFVTKVRVLQTSVVAVKILIVSVEINRPTSAIPSRYFGLWLCSLLLQLLIVRSARGSSKYLNFSLLVELIQIKAM